MKSSIYTIGYEGVTLETFVQTLKSAEIDILLDVRAVPVSRKPGFSKNKLAARLAEDGIRYLGLRELGTPAEGRAAARKGRIGEMQKIFKMQLKTEDAQRDLAEAESVVRSHNACLLCFEHDPRSCHRLLVAETLAERTRQPVMHLKPPVL
jgi:uncharacterized protein (DUF488 family)